MSELFNLPGPARFTAGLASLVRGGRSVLVHVPAGQAIDLLPALSAVLEADGYPCHRLPDMDTPAQAIAWALSAEDEITTDWQRQLLAHERFRRSDVFLGELTASTWPAWEVFLKDFEAEAARWDPFERPRMVLLQRVRLGEDPADAETPLTAVRTWRGQVGELDVRVHVGTRLLSRELFTVQRKLLTEMIIALSLWDLDLADRLLELTPDALSDPLPALVGHARERGWTPETPAAWELGTEEQFDGSLQLHSAYAAITGRIPILGRREWEAQASVVLPLLDRQRRDLVEEGFECFQRAFPHATEPADLYEKDIGRLCHALNVHGGPKDLKQWAESLRWYRNELAHLRPLPFGTLYNYRRWLA